MQQDTLRQVGPVLLSILVIIAVAVVRNYSKTLAAITSTMPITIPLSLWIIYAGSGSDNRSLRQFTDTLPMGLLRTMAFTLAVWWGARSGWRLPQMIAVGYVAWALVLGLMLWIRSLLLR